MGRRPRPQKKTQKPRNPGGPNDSYVPVFNKQGRLYVPAREDAAAYELPDVYRLRELLQQEPGLSERQYGAKLLRSQTFVRKWAKRLAIEGRVSLPANHGIHEWWGILRLRRCARGFLGTYPHAHSCRGCPPRSCNTKWHRRLSLHVIWQWPVRPITTWSCMKQSQQM